MTFTKTGWDPNGSKTLWLGRIGKHKYCVLAIATDLEDLVVTTIMCCAFYGDGPTRTRVKVTGEEEVKVLKRMATELAHGHELTKKDLVS